MSHDRSLHKYYQLIFNKLFFCTVIKGERIYNKTMRTLFISIGILAPHLIPLFFIWMVDIPIQA